MTEFIIGVDSGGTTTIAEAYTIEGELLTRAKTGFGNLLIDETQALDHLRQAIDTIFETLDPAFCKGIVFGIAGIDTGDYQQMVYDAFSAVTENQVILNDAWLAHYALLEGEDGCLIISGTGSVAFGRYGDKEARVGGWGHLLGDAGSGYAIAKHLIQDVLAAYDKGKDWSPLEQKLFEQGPFTDPFELTRFVYHSSKDQVANLATIVAQEAKNQDKQAIYILQKAGFDLGTQAIQLFNKLGGPAQKRLAVTGSVLLKNDLVYQVFQDKVLSAVQTCRFVREDVSNTIGAVYYFKTNGFDTGEEGKHD